MIASRMIRRAMSPEGSHSPRVFARRRGLLLGAAALLVAGCETPMTTFGTTVDGKTVDVFTLRNAHGIEVELIGLGATIVSLRVPDRDGVLADVVLGYDRVAPYEDNPCYFGCTTGRVTNRIAGGRFFIDGIAHQLSLNEGPNHLHGGVMGLHRVVWRGTRLPNRGNGEAVRFEYLSPDGEEGYPGNLHVSVTYELNDADELRVTYEATTDATTPVNLSNHSYFNLRGEGNGDITDHSLQIVAEQWTPLGPGRLPTGDLVPIGGSALDFQRMLPIAARIDQAGGGYDCNYALKKVAGQLATAAVLHEPESGRLLNISTTAPGLQVYTADFGDGGVVGKHGHVYGPRSGICLEPQGFPDAVNHANFPSVLLYPGETYRQTTVYAFKVRPR